MNEFLFFVTIAVNFVGLTVSYAIFKKTGLFIWIAFATIIANLEVLKCVDMFGLSVTLGNVIYGTLFLATDVLGELYSGKEARRGVMMGFFSMLVFTVLTQLALLFKPNGQDIVSGSLEQIFSFMPRIFLASMAAYLISNILDTYAFDWVKEKTHNSHLWLRSSTTAVSQMIDTVVFTSIAFIGVFPFNTVLQIMLFTYIVKLIVCVLDTPFLYLMKKISKKVDPQSPAP